MPDPTPKLTAEGATQQIVVIQGWDTEAIRQVRNVLDLMIRAATSKAFEEAAEIRPKRPSVLSGWNDGIAAYSAAIRALAKEPDAG